MSIETTHKVYRQDAINMLKQKRITVFDDDCNDRLAYLLYENRDSKSENYDVVHYTKAEEKTKELFPWRFWKYGW